MPQTTRTFLMFPERAEEAMEFYASIFDDAAIESVQRFGAEGPGAEGTLFQGRLSLGGHMVMFTDTIAPHDFTFTPASSLFVDVESEVDLDRIAAALVDGGQYLMPPAEYGFSTKFAWVADRYGVSWQVNLA